MVEPESKNYKTTWRMHIECWVSKATLAHSHAQAHAPGHPHIHARAHRKIAIVFLQQQWFRERATVLRYRCVTCLV